jgi:hypothetical protein
MYFHRPEIVPANRIADAASLGVTLALHDFHQAHAAPPSGQPAFLITTTTTGRIAPDSTDP